MTFKQKILSTLAALFVIFVTTLFLAKSTISSEDEGTINQTVKLFSKSAVMSAFDSYKNLLHDDYGPNPVDDDYVMENLSHPYYERIRNDERLKHFYSRGTLTLDDYLLMKEWLRGLFPHGSPSKSYFGLNLLKMIDAAKKGERYLCGDISKMLCQMIMASGTYARIVRITDKNGAGHVVMEFWSKEFDKWVLLDPDYNVHYTSLDIPLNGVELFRMSKNGDSVIKHKGKSDNTLFNSKTKLYEDFYINGVGIDFYNKWVSRNYNRSNPLRSPVNSCIYIGCQPDFRMYFKYDFSLNDRDMIYLAYKNPFLL